MPVVPPQYTQAPGDILDYPVDFFDALAPGEQITSATFTPPTYPTGLTIVDQDYTVSNATAWLTSTTLDANYQVVCTASTNQDRTYNRTIYVRIAYV